MSQGKAQIRSDIRSARARRRTYSTPIDEVGSLAAAWSAIVADLGVRASASAALFVPTRNEPDVMGIVEATQRPLLPVLVGPDGPLSEPAWAWHEAEAPLVAPDPRRPGQPVGMVLSAQALCEVDVILIAALAVDSLGNRLGQGGGWYDRALTYRRPEVPVVAAIFDEEFFDEAPWPMEPHDQRVNGVITPTRSIVLSR